MRHEIQQRDNIRVGLEVVLIGVGQTGLSPTSVLKRVFDGLYWNGTVFQTGVVANAMAEVDSTDQPGFYLLTVPDTAIDPVLGADGYEAMTVETTKNIREHIRIEVLDEVSELPLIGGEGVLSATVLDAHEKVQVGVMHQVNLALQSQLPVNGKAGAFTLDEAFLTVGSTVTDLVAAGLTMPELVELGRPTPSGSSTAVTATPVFAVGGGPGGEDVYTITVVDSSGFSVGGHLRGADKPAGQGHVHVVLQVPSGTSIVVHSSSSNFDIINGDTVEEVDPSGVYSGFFELDVDLYMAADRPKAQLRVVVSTTTTGDAPKFVADTQLVWTRSLELDLSSHAFRTG